MTRLSPPTAFRPGWKTRRIDALIWAARGAVGWERAWPALWPATGIAGLVLAAALFDLFARIPWPRHALILSGAITAMGLSLYFAFENVRWPRWQDGARRLERDSALANRPLTESEDVLTAGAGNRWAEELWRAHQLRLLAGLKSL